MISLEPAEVHRHTFPADRGKVRAVRDQFINMLTESPLDQREIDGWRLAITELAFNAVSHGAKDNPDKEVTIEWTFDRDSVRVISEDPGEGPPDHRILNPKLPDDPLSESGRGLYILNEFVDEMKHWRSPHGFRIELVKNYPGMGRIRGIASESEPILEELAASYESLAIFYRLAQNLQEVSDLGRFVSDALENFRRLHPFDRVFLLSTENAPNSFRETLSEQDWFLDYHDSEPIFHPLSEVDKETVWETPNDLEFLGLGEDYHLGHTPGCILPVSVEEVRFGTLIALRKPNHGSIHSRSLSILRTLADLCGISCTNLYLRNVRTKAQRDLRDFEIAVGIQKSLLPIIQPPTSDHWDAQIRQTSSLSVAGDYATARLDSDGNLVLAIIDVMGKGVSAALLASVFRTAFELLSSEAPVNRLLDLINRTLIKQLGDMTMFITAAVARYNPTTQVIEHASAGHCPTILLTPDGKTNCLSPSGPPLGITPDPGYENDIIHTKGGERLFFVTDGCYEWDREGSDDAGWQKLVDFIEERRDEPVESIWEQLDEKVTEASGGKPDDDCTLVTLQTKP